MSYCSFDEKLKRAQDSASKVKISAEGLSDNVFFQNVWMIHELNLPTLKIRGPRVYKTIETPKFREALVLTGFFQASRFKSPRQEDLEIEIPEPFVMSPYVFNRFHETIVNKRNWKFESSTTLQEYGGGEAVRVAVKALSTLFANLVKPNYPYPAEEAEKYFKLALKDKEAFNHLFRVAEDCLWKYKRRIAQLLEIEF